MKKVLIKILTEHRPLQCSPLYAYSEVNLSMLCIELHNVNMAKFPVLMEKTPLSLTLTTDINQGPGSCVIVLCPFVVHWLSAVIKEGPALYKCRLLTTFSSFQLCYGKALILMLSLSSVGRLHSQGPRVHIHHHPRAFWEQGQIFQSIWG